MKVYGLFVFLALLIGAVIIAFWDRYDQPTRVLGLLCSLGTVFGSMFMIWITLHNFEPAKEALIGLTILLPSGGAFVLGIAMLDGTITRPFDPLYLGILPLLTICLGVTALIFMVCNVSIWDLEDFFLPYETTPKRTNKRRLKNTRPTFINHKLK